jgi:hypothetical protein
MARPTLAVASLLLVGAVATAPARAQTLTADAVVGAVIDAYGGRDVLGDVEALRLEGTIVTATQGEHGNFVRVSEGQGHLKVLLHYPQRVEIRVVEGTDGWSGGSPQTLAAAKGPMLAAMQLQAARSWVPWILDEMRDRLTIERTDSALVVMSGGLKPGLALRFYVRHRLRRLPSGVRGAGALPRRELRVGHAHGLPHRGQGPAQPAGRAAQAAHGGVSGGYRTTGHPPPATRFSNA